VITLLVSFFFLDKSSTAFNAAAQVVPSVCAHVDENLGLIQHIVTQRLARSLARWTMATESQPKNLFDYTEEQLLQEKILTYYEILNLPPHASSDDVKKAYRRTSLKYHPDKTGRGQEDYVFLAVKEAYDTLRDDAKRQAYDSTDIPFDDSIPPKDADGDFYETFGPVFKRNLRFDAMLRPEKKKGKKQNNKASHTSAPELGNDDTPIEDVHRFYDYWTRFESWRDFSSQAATELQVETEDVESRFEKRYLQKEIDKLAKQLKRKEIARIQQLVERAREADPRLKRERIERALAKERAALEKKEREAEEKRQAEEAAKAEKERVQLENERKVEEKKQREQEKKRLRKARQRLRKLAKEAFDEAEDTSIWKDAYDMNQCVEQICTKLGLVDLDAFSDECDATECKKTILQMIAARLSKAVEAGIQTASSGSQIEKENKEDTEQPVKRVNIWTKDELSALAKAVKKYPPGGSSRWEQISLFVNNLCKQAEPRTKEECIEKYNTVARQQPKQAASPAAQGEEWTKEEDQLLQSALSQFPASMDKNERWTQIAEMVPGKTKKQCVTRFKAIRDAIKNKK